MLEEYRQATCTLQLFVLPPAERSQSRLRVRRVREPRSRTGGRRDDAQLPLLQQAARLYVSRHT